MTSYVNYLKQSEIFFQFTSTQLELVANLCKEAVYDAGDEIFPENNDSNELYIIIQGEVDISVSSWVISGENSGGSDSAIAKLRRGQSFGEIALVDEGLRSASARATQKDTRLLVIPRDKLMMLCETYPQLGFRLMYNLAADLAMKIRNTDLRVRGRLLYQPQSSRK